MKLQGSQYSARAAGTHAKLEIDRGCGEMGLQRRKPAWVSGRVFLRASEAVELDVLAEPAKRVKMYKTAVESFRAFPGKGLGFLAFWFFLVFPSRALGQTWEWTSETVDASGESISIAADLDGNLHMSYLAGNQMVRYGFRPAHTPRWFTMEIPGTPTEGNSHMPTRIALDPKGNPHVCLTPGVLKYASFDGKRWSVQQIDPGIGLVSFTCSVAIAPDGTQHVVWYQYGVPGGGYYLHVKHAVLQNGVWMARTIDFEGQTGKWNSISIDAQGMVHATYDSFLKGQLKYALWNGKEWHVSIVDPSGGGGMGNSVLVNRDGEAQVSYEHDDKLLYAWQTPTSWKIETVNQISTNGGWLGFRSRQALDPQGNPHIVYEDGGAVEHAFWDGSGWKIQLVSARGLESNRFCDIAIDSEGTIYIAFRDANDGSVKVVVGRPQTPAKIASAADGKKEK